MKITYLILFLVFTLSNVGCQAQVKNDLENKNPLMSDPESGVCELPAHKTSLTDSTTVKAQKKPIKIIYFTDPICSSCWGIEPQLRKLKSAYGEFIEIEYRMGGLLPDWNYNSGGISKPSDVAHHWDEVSVYYDMPIDGDVWLEDPLSSSYPPSIAFKAAQMQDKEKAVMFLRAIREMVFLEKKNITKWEHLALAGKKVGLDLVKFKQDYEGKAKELFEEDLKLSSEFGVRGFPTMFFTDSTGKKEMVYGVKPFTTFETTLLKLCPTATKKNYDKTWSALFSTYTSMTAKEFSELTEMPRTESENYLNTLTIQGKLEKFTTKNGSIWTLKKIGG